MLYRLCAVTVVGAAACGNVSGNIAATKTGDVSRPAERGSPVEAIRAACGGNGEATTYGAPALKRQPYLQQVTASSAMLGWVTTDPTNAKVTITTPEGTMLTTAQADVEDYALRSDGENQVWSTMPALEPGTV